MSAAQSVPPLYCDSDSARIAATKSSSPSEDYRSPWRRDQARLIHCPSFRRLQGKTQVFPGHEGDFFRNRLTHSLEVAQIGKSIAIKLNAKFQEFAAPERKLDPDIVEFAGLAHDLGHPPFGHNGEQALDMLMRNCGGFEGNAQTLRILSCLEKKVLAESHTGQRHHGTTVNTRFGLNLAYRSLASILKYDNIIPKKSKDRNQSGVVKGYYASDAELVKKIKEAVVGKNYTGKFKTVECTIMDVADDIAYSTYDLEDVFKSGFLKPMDLFVLDKAIYDAVLVTINKRLAREYGSQAAKITEADVKEILLYVFVDLFEVNNDDKQILRNKKIGLQAKKAYFSAQTQELSRELANNGFHRTALTSNLVQIFLDGIEVVAHKTYPQLNKVRLNMNDFILMEVLKNITYEAVIRSPALQVVEYRGKEIIEKIFNAIVGENGQRLLPEDFREVYESGNKLSQYRTVCDFIAGMTDRYAVEFYSRLYGANGLTMHKPL